MKKTEKIFILIFLLFTLVSCVTKEPEKEKMNYEGITEVNNLITSYLTTPDDRYQTIIAKYEALSNSEQLKITNYQEFEEAYTTYLINLNITNIINEINKLDDYEPSDSGLNEQLNVIKVLLNNCELDQITNYEKYTNKVKELQEYKYKQKLENLEFSVVCDNSVMVDSSIICTINYEFDEVVEFEFSCSNDNIEIINNDSQIEIFGNLEGSTVLQVKVKGTNNFQNINITITPKIIKPVSILYNGKTSIHINDTIDLTMIIMPINANKEVVYNVDRPDLVTLNGNTLKALKEGEVSIKITSVVNEKVNTTVIINITKEGLNNDITLFPDVTRDMTVASYWLDLVNNTNDILLSLDDINNYNNQAFKLTNTKMVDITNQSETISGSQVKSKIQSYTFNQSSRINGVNPPSGYGNSLVQKTNLVNIPTTIIVEYGLVNSFCALRSFPTFDVATTSNEFDRFQETGLEIGSGCLIYHTSSDGKWLFVQTYNYFGWVYSDNILKVTKQEMLDYINASDFIIVTGKQIVVDNIIYRLSTKLPIVGEEEDKYICKVPSKTSFINVNINKDLDVHHGYVEYTTNNILSLMFKLLGTPYRWGDSDVTGHDCSSTCNAPYVCCGFIMPRNTSNQQNYPLKQVSFSGCNDIQRKAIFDTVIPGSLVFVSGHVMMYLGKDNGNYYIIHNFGSGGGCNITTVNINRSGSQTYLQAFTVILEMK